MYFKNSNKVLPKIINSINSVVKDISNPVAAFDADGTLWATDAGDIFYQYLIDQKCIDLPEEPWPFYLNKKASNPKSAYLWLAQIFKGVEIDQVRKWAQEAFDASQPTPIFEEQKEIINVLHNLNVSVYIVTASVKWAVEPYSKLYNIPSENVIGVETKVKNNKVTDIQNGPITYREGKVDGLKSKETSLPFFIAGNTFGDLDLLKSSTHIRMTLQSAKPSEEIYKSELELFEYANKNGWFSLQ